MAIQDENLESLFSEIKKIQDEYKKHKEFNAFNAIGFNCQETMHSSFIAFLLNPEADHRKGSVFLKLFIKELELQSFNVTNVKVQCEKSANRRRIDIAVENPSQILIIENKIWANDQPKQLVDYYKWAKNVFKDVFVVYLTPSGAKPSDDSMGNGELPIEKVKCVSYETQILNWLNSCVLVCSPEEGKRLKISIEMYEELIRTVINRDRYMEEIIKFLMNNPNQMGQAIDIAKAMQRNFLEFNSFSRDRIIDNIQRALDYKCNSYAEGELQCIDLDDIDGLSISVYRDCIYGEYNKNRQSTVNTELEVPCNDIKNPYLIDLLINNQVGIQRWIQMTIDKLNGDTENHIE